MTEEQYRKNALRHARWQTALLVLLCVAVLTTAGFAGGSIASMKRTMEMAEKKLEQLDMEKIGDIVAALQSITAQLQQLDLSGLDETAEALNAEGISVRVIDMPFVKPIDRELIVTAAAETKGMIALEEHSIYGGLGSAVAEVMAESACSSPLVRMGLDDFPKGAGKKEVP